MRTVESSIDIAVTPATLFDFMLSAEHATEWRDRISRMEWLEPPRVGARARLYFWAEGRERMQELTLIEHERPHGYTFEHHGEGFRSVLKNVIVPAGDGSQLTCTVDVTGDTIWGSMLLPMLKRRQRRRTDDVFAKLKTAVEKRR